MAWQVDRLHCRVDTPDGYNIDDGAKHASARVSPFVDIREITAADLPVWDNLSIRT
jgi:hypothetical protein